MTLPPPSCRYWAAPREARRPFPGRLLVSTSSGGYLARSNWNSTFRRAADNRDADIARALDAMLGKPG